MGKKKTSGHNLKRENSELRKKIKSLEARIAQLENPSGEDLLLNEQIRYIFNSLPLGMALVRDRIFITVNQRFCQLTGYSEEELIGQNTRMLYSNLWDYEFIGREKYKQLENSNTAETETTWQRKDGTILNIALRLSLYNQSDPSQGVIFSAEDITSLKKTRLELENSEARMKAIFNNAPDIIYLCNTEGTIVEGNPALAHILNIPTSQLPGLNFLKLGLFDEDGNILAQKLLYCSSIGQATGPDRLKITVPGTGKTAHVELLTYPIVLDGKRLMLGIARNLTNWIRQEELKFVSEQRVAMHMNQTAIAVIEWDLDFKITQWNPGAEKMFGYTKKEALGKGLELILPNYTPSLNEKIRNRIIQGNARDAVSNWNRNKKGDLLFCKWINTALRDEKNEIVAFASLGFDITHTVRSEKIQRILLNIANAVSTSFSLLDFLNHVENQLSDLITTQNLFVSLYQPASNTIKTIYPAQPHQLPVTISAEKSLAEIVIRKRQTLAASDVKINRLIESNELLPLNPIPKMWIGVPLINNRSILGVIGVQSFEKRRAFRKADLRLLELVSTQVALSIQQKNTELEMSKAYEKAKESERLKSAFLANISHEIRTPMNGILGFVNLLKSEDLTADNRRKYLEIIEESSIRMLGLINNLIDISKIEAGIITANNTHFNLGELIENLVSFFKPEIKEKQLEFEYSIPASLNDVIIYSDSQKVHSILSNLIKNAIKYTHEGKINFNVVPSGKNIRFEVVDTGVGIRKEEYSKIFQRFTQVGTRNFNNLEGVGLGLAISKAYAETLNGKIWLNSEYGKGSTFIFELPVIETSYQTPTENSPQNPQIHTQMKKKILIADDEAINQRLFGYMLKGIADELTFVGDGTQAVETFKNDPSYNVILMDLKMVNMDGYEATSEILNLSPEAKVIALSAFPAYQEKQKALDHGFSDYISKPVSKESLIETVKKYL